ncbi:MAG: helix-turn-helix transcriptional regulator [Ruminococcus sp.]|nr:helix-turn-helix transcriptional regulator [Ruminococcus sp.]
MDTYTTIKNRILYLLEKNSLSIHHLALKSGVAPSTIKNILYGKSQNPGIVTLKLICEGFEISLYEFFDMDEFRSKVLENMV